MSLYLESTNKEEFTDSAFVSRSVLVFEPHSHLIKGTIVLLLGGYLDDKNPETVIVGSKGWRNSTINNVNEQENKVIEQLTELKWRILIFESMQFAKPDDTITNEFWIDDYVEWINKKFSENGKKIFMIGFSSGAYILGLHLRHLIEGRGKGSMTGYGIFSYSVTIDNKSKKTDFRPEHFKIPTLFLSGSSKEDGLANEPKVDGYNKTRKIYQEFAVKSGVHHGWQALNTGHSIFKLQSNKDNNKQAVTNIIDNWFCKEKFPGNLISDGTSKENVKNPDVTFE
jgi:hypothetical protein